jgi:hypothetical protein
MTGAQFEIRIDGTPRTYRDRKDYAMEAARFIKSKNPHSLVVRPLNNYRHAKSPLPMGHGASRLILRGVVLLGPFSLGFHCGQSSTECSHPCGDSRFLSYSL